MNDLAQRQYRGDGEKHKQPLADAWTTPEPYLPSLGLIEAVNVALYLRRPLLLEGDPGCGKTRLAYAVAYELGYPLMECYIHSNHRARDLLYTYDAVRRLYDIQEKTAKPHKEYVSLGPLGQAIQLSENDQPSVVLIDEIDKADIDFPNDLLLTLDRLWFKADEVPESKSESDSKGGFRIDAHKEDKTRKDMWPLIIITSNREKELPKAFLRRCLFYYIPFPDESALQQILVTHFPHLKETPLFSLALSRFWQLKKALVQWRKALSTSELLDWIEILERDEKLGKLTVEKLKDVNLKDLPHLEVLVKTQSDLEALRR